MKLGIVPAGGSAYRFGGVLKELLPIDKKTLLAHCVGAMSFCDAILVLTTPDKVCAHINALREYPNIFYTMSKDTLWESIKQALLVEADQYYFAMPDTLFPSVALRMEPTNLAFGTFETDLPERYGVFVDDVIHDKANMTGTAWGTVAWSLFVRNYWMTQSYQNHTEAFNDAIDKFGYNIVNMDYYFDFASLQDWKTWLINNG